jgi:hypothetical protein
LVDGLRSGTTPVTIELPAGQYRVRVEMDGYEPLEQTVDLVASEEIIVGGELAPTAPTVTLVPTRTLDVGPILTATTAPTTPPGADASGPRPDLVVSNVRVELETGGACDYTSTDLGLTVLIKNTGPADAGPFEVEANGARQTVEAGLPAGQTARLWFQGYAHSGENVILADADSQVKEIDETNNQFSGMVPIPTLPPTCTPPPSPSATTEPPPAVAIREGQVTIPTYPYADYTTMVWDASFNLQYAAFDRAAYEAANPQPRDATYRTLEMENEYLKLTFLPDVGGRLYEVIYKPTGHRETYRNPVLKPSPWGPPQQGGWLAAGGIEWCFPVEEHGYEWGVPWIAEVEHRGREATLTLRDTTANDRVRAVITVRLRAEAASFTIRPRLENPTDAPVAVKYWTNAMLAPGGGNAPSADLRFVLPNAVTAVTIHSRGDDLLPRYNERMPWPVFNGVDYSRLGNWNRWLGLFEDPAVGERSTGSSRSFMAVYDEASDEGMVRVFPADVAQGAKLFAFGWSDSIPTHNWTDDHSSYVEMHGGPAPTFDDSVTIPAGGHLAWTETWYPVAGLGRLRYANETAALNLSVGGEQSAGQRDPQQGLPLYLVATHRRRASGKRGTATPNAQLAAAVTRAWSGNVVLLLNGQEVWRRAVSLAPDQPFWETVPLDGDAPPTGQVTFRLEAPDGAVAAEYSTSFNLR